MKQKNKTNFISLENVSYPEEAKKRSEELKKNLIVSGRFSYETKERIDKNVHDIIKFPLKSIGYDNYTRGNPRFYYLDADNATLRITHANCYDEYGPVIFVEREHNNTYTKTTYGISEDRGYEFITRDKEILIKYPDREIFYAPLKDETGCLYFSIKFKEFDTEFNISSENLPVEEHIKFALSLEPKIYTAQELYSKLTSFFNKEFDDVSIDSGTPIDKSKLGSYIFRSYSTLKSIYKRESGKVRVYGESFSNGDFLVVVYDPVSPKWIYINNKKISISGSNPCKEGIITVANISSKDFFNFNFSEIQKNIDENLEKFLSYLETF